MIKHISIQYIYRFAIDFIIPIFIINKKKKKKNKNINERQEEGSLDVSWIKNDDKFFLPVGIQK